MRRNQPWGFRFRRLRKQDLEAGILQCKQVTSNKYDGIGSCMAMAMITVVPTQELKATAISEAMAKAATKAGLKFMKSEKYEL